MDSAETHSVVAERKWSPLRKGLHWSVVAPCLAQLPTARAIGRVHHVEHSGQPPQPLDLSLHEVHAVVGMFVFSAVCPRLLLRRRIRSRVASLSRSLLETARTVTHVGLHGLVVILPVSGFLTMYVTRSAAPVHRLGVEILWVLATVHVAAALFHTIVLRDRTLAGMLPERWSGILPGRRSS
jgi:cytochrome b561